MLISIHLRTKDVGWGDVKRLFLKRTSEVGNYLNSTRSGIMVNFKIRKGLLSKYIFIYIIH